ncbi:helix-turn-helix domain-containing protein [Rhodococcus sp. F64268]|uniref:helix-turn-helix domain-containing protein n=1 Tax=Rhodococcus sp. F64268 TaxID=2926402 RepID=UPI001FF34AD1|nr:helix-turn-helix domain-containing protein [Rhodococcus sp. F64268]MCK0090493.1 helix-turn-helix domain-containing protein [Rhodococcus sp. F64268]
MSIEAIIWTLEHAEIPSPTPPGMPSAPTLTLVLLGLANHASRHGDGAYPSVRRLAAYARLSERQVQRCLAALVDLGLIDRGDQARVAATIPREDRRPTCYDLKMQRGDTPSSRLPQRGDSSAADGVTERDERGDGSDTRTVPDPSDEPAAPARTQSPAENAPTAQRPDTQLDDLAAACRRAGLTARFDTLTTEKAAMIADFLAIHGIEALVRAALTRHRPDDPARSAAAWISTWQQLQPPRPKLPPTCGQCDEYGWLPDDDLGRAVRCPCRRLTSEQPSRTAKASHPRRTWKPNLAKHSRIQCTRRVRGGRKRPAARAHKAAAVGVTKCSVEVTRS